MILKQLSGLFFKRQSLIRNKGGNTIISVWFTKYTALLYVTCDLTSIRDDIYVHVHKAASAQWLLEVIIIIIFTATIHELLPTDLTLSSILHTC